MSKILSHKGNANQNDIVIPSHHSLSGYHQGKKTAANAGKDAGKRETYTLLVGM
jgi:hypothetical protein